MIFHHFLILFSLLFAAKMTKRLVDEIHCNFQRLQDLKHGNISSRALTSILTYYLF